MFAAGAISGALLFSFGVAASCEESAKPATKDEAPWSRDNSSE
jgi:hypothetical protein